MGDTSLSSELFGINFEMGAFFRRYAELIRDEQVDLHLRERRGKKEGERGETM